MGAMIESSDLLQMALCCGMMRGRSILEEDDVNDNELSLLPPDETDTVRWVGNVTAG